MFSKLLKNKTTTVYLPIEGKPISLSEVPDKVFSQKLMGEGFAVKPDNGKLFSPIKGKVESIFPTKHAIMLKSNSGIDVLVHIGIDTVDLGGKGIEILVKVGQKVDQESQLASIDLSYIQYAGKATEVIVVFPELTTSKDIAFNLSGKTNILAELTN